MQSSSLVLDNQNLLGWSLVLGLGFPFLILLLGEIVLRLERRDNSLAVPFQILRNFFLPTVALFLLLTKVLRLNGDTVPVRLVETLLWIFLIYAALLILNIVLFEDAREGSWRADVPKLFLDLSRFFLVLVGAAVILSTVWGTDLGGLITALGVGSLVIGLALQDSLGNIFSGIALLFERPVDVDDWVEIDGEFGKVIDVNWRSVHLQTLTQDLWVVPNSQMASRSFKNLSRPTPRHVKTFTMRFSLNDPPYKARQVLYDTAFETEGVLKDPAPIIRTVSYDDFSITYLIILFFESFERSLSAPDAFVTRLWYAARRYGLTIPYPVRLQGETQEASPSPEENQDQILSILRNMPLLRNLDPSTITHLAQTGHLKEYAQDEVILSTGNLVPGLYVVIQGQLEMTQPHEINQEIVVSHLFKGDYFGEESSVLGNQSSEVTVRAITDVQLLMLNEALLEPLVDHNPRLATEIGEVMELRRRKRRTLQRQKADGKEELNGNQNGSFVRSGSD